MGYWPVTDLEQSSSSTSVDVLTKRGWESTRLGTISMVGSEMLRDIVMAPSFPTLCAAIAFNHFEARERWVYPISCIRLWVVIKNTHLVKQVLHFSTLLSVPDEHIFMDWSFEMFKGTHSCECCTTWITDYQMESHVECPMSIPEKLAGL